MLHSLHQTGHGLCNRRSFLGTSALAALQLAGCGSTSSKPGEFQGQTLRIFVYAGGHETTMREVFVPTFEAATGARVILDSGWWDAIARLKTSPAGKPAFDLMVTDATQGYPAAREGLFQTIRRQNLKNLQHLSPAILDNWIVREGHGITFPDSVMTLAYHQEMVPSSLEGWEDLLRPELSGKIALYNSFYMSLYTFACMMAAAEKKPGEAAALLDKDLEGVLRFAKIHRKNVKFWWPNSSDMILSLEHRDCAAGNMHSPEMLVALEQSKTLGAVIPQHDRAFVQLFWAIPAGTPNTDLAERALDAIFSPEMQLGFTRHGSATANLEVARQRAAENPLWKQIYPHTEEQLQAIRYYPYDTYFRNWNDLSSIWQREILTRA